MQILLRLAERVHGPDSHQDDAESKLADQIASVIVTGRAGLLW
jgi:hypothetical protein